MDLYGDLPPAAGEENQTSEQPSTACSRQELGAASSSSKAKKNFASLAFKPRQTTTRITQPTKTSGSIGVSKSGLFVGSANPVIASSGAGPEHAIAPSLPAPLDRGDFNANSNFDVVDPYDPSRPNDYIAYCQERLERRKQVRLQQDNQKLMEEQERLRKTKEEERRLAAQRGDFQALVGNIVGESGGIAGKTFNAIDSNLTSELPIISTGMGDGLGSTVGGGIGRGRGRGRGRGVSNLPAWVVQQMNEAAATGTAAEEQKDTHSDTITTGAHTVEFSTTSVNDQLDEAVGMKRKKKPGQFRKPSCVVLLKNMVGPDDVDDTLAAETEQECQKFGPVTSCVVYQVKDQSPKSINSAPVSGMSSTVTSSSRCPDEERVRMFVAFERQDSAVRAYRELDGRFFAGRKVSASFYDEIKFRQGDLAPEPGEW